MIKFSKYIWLYFFVSAVVLIPGIVSLVGWGLRPSIDFTGGTLLELKYPEGWVSTDSIRQTAQKFTIGLTSIIPGSDNTVLIRMKSDTSKNIAPFAVALVQLSSPSASMLRDETVGPILGKELLSKAIVAAIFAITAILGYVAYAFKNFKFGVSAVIALFHDLLVVLGCFSLFGVFLGIEVDTLFVTAFLTTMSFSVHDTIVVFDRIRELRRRGEKGSFEDICDKALTETMGRSLTNSFTIIFMLLALILMGGETIRWFVVALLIGTISGTYSSPFVATPILILLHRRRSSLRSLTTFFSSTSVNN